MSGAENWSNEIGKQDYGPPVFQAMDKDHVYHNYSGMLRKVNIRSGSEDLKYNWSLHQEGRLEGPMLVHEDQFFALISYGNANNKILKWASCPADQIQFHEWKFYENIFPTGSLTTRDISNPIMIKNEKGEQLLIYSKNEENYSSASNYIVVAYNLDLEKMEWSRKNSHSDLGGEPVIVDNDKVYYYHAYDLHCIDAATGTPVWTNEFNTSINIDEFASIGKYLFVYDYKANIQVIDKQSGEKILIKKFEDIEDTFASGYENNSIQIYKDQIYYINSRGSLMRIDIQSGEHQRYHFAKSADGFTGPSLLNNGMVIASDGIIYTSDGENFIAFEAPNE